MRVTIDDRVTEKGRGQQPIDLITDEPAIARPAAKDHGHIAAGLKPAPGVFVEHRVGAAVGEHQVVVGRHRGAGPDLGVIVEPHLGKGGHEVVMDTAVVLDGLAFPREVPQPVQAHRQAPAGAMQGGDEPGDVVGQGAHE